MYYSSNKIFPRDLFFDWLETNKLSARTKQEYLRYFHRFNCMDELNQEGIDSFIRRNNNNVARAFLRNLKECIGEYGNDYFTPEQMIVINNLKIKKIKGNAKKEEKEKVVLTKQEIDKIVNVFTKDKPKIMLMVSYYCSLRVTELFDVRGRDFNWDIWEENQDSNGLLTIKGKGGSVNTVLVPSFLMNKVFSYLVREFPKGKEQRRESLIFNFLGWEYNLHQGKPADEKVKLLYSKGNYNRWYRLLNKAANKALGKDVSSHVFRRSFATHLHEGEWGIKEIQEHLRHKDISTTQIYTQISKQHLKDKYNKFVGDN